MDYLEIVLQGYYNENNREHLVDYFFSEFKKAEKETFCSSDLFFGGCMKIIDAFNENYQQQIFKQQIQLDKYLVSKQEIDEDFVKSFKAQIEYQKLNGWTNFRLKNGMMLHLKRNEITYIENAIKLTKARIHLKDLPPQRTETKIEQETPKTFEALFYDVNFVSPCIDILKKLEPPLIDTECNYIGNSKGAFCVWIDEMHRQGIVKHFSDRKIFASLIPQKIKRFSIDESMFGKPQRKAEDRYRTDMKTLLSKVKLSHKGTL
jgi:hypothetical protein